MNEENDWDHNAKGDAEGPVVCVSREVVKVLNEMKTGKPLDLQIYHWS